MIVAHGYRTSHGDAGALSAPGGTPPWLPGLEAPCSSRRVAFLAHQGVKPLVVERHSGTAIHPRAGHFHLRTLELLRSVDLEEAVRRTSEERYGLCSEVVADGPLFRSRKAET